MARRRGLLTRARRGAGFTLVELMVVVAMIGILAAAAGTSFSKYVRRSHTSEAVGHLQKLWMGSIAYFEADHADANNNVVPHQFPGSCGVGIESDCCMQGGMCAASDPTYSSNPWMAVGFNIPSKHYYRPIYWACPNNQQNLWLEAWGDLDCDGIYGRFIMKANVGPKGQVSGYTTPAIINELE